MQSRTHAEAPPAPTEPASQPDRFLNRELSMLDYMERVLAIAEDHRRPLLERVDFLAMSSYALDDFFQIRVAGLKEQFVAGPTLTSPDGMTPAEQLRAIRGRVETIVDRHTRLFVDHLRPLLAEHGIKIVDAHQLSEADLESTSQYFRERIFPVLTPLAVDPGHPFPYISNLSLNLAVLVRDPLRRRRSFARLKVPPLLPRFVPLPDGERYISVEQVIAGNLQSLFPGMTVVSSHVFRVTRDADLDLVESEAEDLLSIIQAELRRKRRRAMGVRLEVEPGMPFEVLQVLVRELELEPEDVYEVGRMLDLHGLAMLGKLPRPDLKPVPWTPATQPRLLGSGAEAPDLFAVIRQGDVLVHHPYDSFGTSVEAFIQQAATDPDVLAIKQTLYRTSGPASPIARSLVQAAEAGKQVVALVELKARGDEQANIEWAQKLEEAGVHVVYGLVGLKTHAKVVLVVRQESDGIRRYVHLGTGNYNPATAQSYEDVGLLTADPDLGDDVTQLFNYLTGYSRPRRYRKLYVAPAGLRKGLLELISGQAKAGGKITIKVNNLVDPGIIDALYGASRAGASVDLIVRGMCCLRPGVEGLSEGIRVRSLVGRFLEHSRIFRFGSGDAASYWIASADLMDRNLDRRVELFAPIADVGLRRQIQHWLDVALADDELASELDSSGRWHKVPRAKGVSSHKELCAEALERAHAR
ncbi:MAG TPA: polyphosphate kinase 1 [Candidatus Dormibacteraeota bacterium]